LVVVREYLVWIGEGIDSRYITRLIDVFDNKASDLFKRDADGWWGDLGEPKVHPAESIYNFDGLQVTGDEIHNAYGHMWAKYVCENQRDIAPKQRPFIMMRSGFVGAQRYSMLPYNCSLAYENSLTGIPFKLGTGMKRIGFYRSNLIGLKQT
jgi:oligosaccharide 4-alpha-D-glucosyltransferase